MKKDNSRDQRDFDSAFRKWAGREARTSPDAAAESLRSRLDDRSGSVPFSRWVLMVATCVLVICVSWLTLRKGSDFTQPSAPIVETASSQSPPLEENVVLWWLDPETPVYFVLSPPNTE